MAEWQSGLADRFRAVQNEGGLLTMAEMQERPKNELVYEKVLKVQKSGTGFASCRLFSLVCQGTGV